MVGILSIGWYLPPGRQSVGQVAEEHGVSPQALASFGLRSKVVPGPDDHPSGLAARAVRAALDAAGLGVDEIDLLIFAGTTRDRPPPWVAAFGVLHQLGATRAAGFDLSARCPGVGDAIWIAASLIRSGSFRHVVVCCGDRFDHLIEPSAAEPSLDNAIFSTGSAAVLLGPGAGNEIAARAHYTREDLSDHASHTPLAGGTLRRFDRRALDERAHLMRDDGSTVAQIAEMRDYFRRAEQRNIAAVCDAAGFDAIDFIAGSTFYVKDQADGWAALGIGPDKYLMVMPDYGHVGPSSALISIGTAIQEGRRVGPRLIMNLRTYFYCNALAVRGESDDLGIRISGTPRPGAAR